MLTSAIVRTVQFCVRHAWSVIAVGLVLAAASTVYTARNFAIDANIDNLLSSKLEWRQREIAYHKEFPQSLELILVVVDGPTPERAAAATQALTQALAKKTDLFRSVTEQGGGTFFRRNGLLFMPTDRLEGMTGQLTRAGPLIGALASDPSLRGLVQALSFATMGVQQQQLPLDAMQRPLNMAAEPIEKVLAGESASFSWKVLLQGEAQPAELRHFISVWPYLNKSELEPAARGSPPSARRPTTSSSHRPTARRCASPDRRRSRTR